MARYIYNGDEDRTFPSLGITVKKGESFDGPEGLRARGLSLDSNATKSAPAVPAAPKQTVKEINKTENKQSASPDITAGA
jgi:hypothetical protein